MVDAGGTPLTYDSLAVMESIVASQSCRIEVDTPKSNGEPGWDKGTTGIDSQNIEGWDDVRDDLQAGARLLLEETWVLSHFARSQTRNVAS